MMRFKRSSALRLPDTKKPTNHTERKTAGKAMKGAVLCFRHFTKPRMANGHTGHRYHST